MSPLCTQRSALALRCGGHHPTPYRPFLLSCLVCGFISVWPSLAPAPDVPPSCSVHPSLTHPSWAVHQVRRNTYVRRFDELRVLVFVLADLLLRPQVP